MSDERAQAHSAVHIRPMVTADIPAVSTILMESPEAAGWSEESFRGSLENQRTLALVAESNDQLAGFLIGGKVGDEAEILNLAVRASRRRLGVARMLVKETVRRWTAQDALQIFLEVRVSNAPAIELYESLGFTKAGYRKNYYSQPEEDALVLERKITQSGK